MTPSTAADADAEDPLAPLRDRFVVPDGVVYLDGNSLGVLPVGVAERVAAAVTDEWGSELIRAWNSRGWVDLPDRVGRRIGRLVGAPDGTVICGDSTSINLTKVLSAALAARDGRRVVLSDTGNFPTDLYMAQGLLHALGDGAPELRLVDPPEVAEAVADVGDDLAVLMLTHVDYRTGRRHDMAALTAAAHAVGALVVWDLAHSAGAMEIDLAVAEADFAVGCSYKYLNGGPGAPAWAYVAPRHIADVQPLLSGWFGHEQPFAFDLDYRPAPGITRLRAGTPPVLSMTALDAALDVFDDVDMGAVRAKSVALCERFIAAVESRCDSVALASPRDAAERGSQVSFRHPEAYAVMQALIARGVIGDVRAPDVLRFGFAPLYLRHADVERAVEVLADVLDGRLWDDPAYRQRAAVT